MKDLPKKHHLMNRDGVWYYRRKVPTDLISKIGTKVIQTSLMTKDLGEAIKRRELKDVETTALFEAARKDEILPLTQAEAIRMVQKYVEHQDQSREVRYFKNPPRNEVEKFDMKADIGFAEQSLRDLDDPQAEESVGLARKRILKGTSYAQGEKGSIAPAEFDDLIRRGLMELYRRFNARLDDDFSNSFFDQLFRTDAKVKMTLGELCTEYFKQYNEEAGNTGIAQKRIDTVRSHLDLLQEALGEDTPVQAIDYDRCMAFRSTLARIPSNRSKIYKNKPLNEAIALAESEGRPPLAYQTQSGYLGTLNKVLELALLKQLISVVPSKGMKPSAKKTPADQQRKSFDDEQICEFFQSPYYKECSSEKSPPYNVEKEHWRFWLPLICLLMGMRPKEVCQLELTDVKLTKKGVHYLSVSPTNDEDEESNGSTNKKTIKTDTSRRNVPIHPEILRIGFLEFVDDQKKTGKQLLFQDLKVNKYGDPAQYALKCFREKYLKEAIKVKKQQAFYSIRHSFRDALRRIEAPPDVLQSLGGWSQGSLVSDAYGDKSDPDYLNTYVQRIEYPGLDLSHLYLKEDD